MYNAKLDWQGYVSVSSRKNPDVLITPRGVCIMFNVYAVNVTEGIQYDCIGDGELHLKAGDDVVIECEKYLDCGQIERFVKEDVPEDYESPQSRRHGGRSSRFGGDRPPRIVRQMTLADKGKAHENEARAKSMFRTAQRKVNEHRLDMKLIYCHYTLDKSLAIFLFVADGRVDFRNLVRDLSGALHTRVELRQIGVRDEAAIQGGIGPCGRPFCCATVLENFESVNVKMAKVQRVSLNPSSVSGGCGRLKCCLRYEADGYREMFRSLPRSGSKCETPCGCGRVLDCNALTRTVRVKLDDAGGQIKDFSADDISARKTQRDSGKQ